MVVGDVRWRDGTIADIFVYTHTHTSHTFIRYIDCMLTLSIAKTADTSTEWSKSKAKAKASYTYLPAKRPTSIHPLY